MAEPVLLLPSTALPLVSLTASENSDELGGAIAAGFKAKRVTGDKIASVQCESVGDAIGTCDAGTKPVGASASVQGHSLRQYLDHAAAVHPRIEAEAACCSIDGCPETLTRDLFAGIGAA